MPTLFVLSHAPHTDPAEGRKVAWARPGDTVLLIEDAVYGGGAHPTPLAAHLAEAGTRGVHCCLLAPDAQARGIQPVLPEVDYAGFVDLLCGHDRAVH